ncbi:MAG: hypothetical protein PHV74_04775 [Dehalococcoidia bacterium]|nr:hypothetical protein [Dehalococcoidia bacterium]
MKTKHTLISVLMILAIVSTLCVVMAVPTAFAADVSATTSISPTSGAGGTVVTAAGTGWTGSQAITGVTVGGAAAIYTLSVSAGGVLSGTITIPAAAVAGANNVVITGATDTATEVFNVSLSTVGFVADPTIAATAALQTVTFNTGAVLTAGVDQVTVTFPTGAYVPAAIAKSNVAVQVNGTGYKPLLSTDPDPSVAGNSVTVLIPATCNNAAAGQVVNVKFFAASGIKNPSVAKVANTYVGKVSTTAETTPVNSATYSAITTIVTFSPAMTTVGSTVTVSGLGFTPGTSIDITGGASGFGTVDATGAFVVSAAAATPAAITATDGAGVVNASATPLVLLPKAVVSPTSGLTGSVIDVTATGLTANTLYAIGVSGVAVPVISATVGTVVAGEIRTPLTGTSFTCKIAIPAGSSAGAKVINVRATTFAAPDLAVGSFTVDARTLTASVSSGYKGDTILMNGAGFEPTAAGSVVTAQIIFTDSAGTPSGNLLTTPASIGADGTFQASVVVPANSAGGAALAAGTGRFTATSSINGVVTAPPTIARATFTINPASISCSPVTGLPGSQVTVTMKGLGAYASYNSVTIDGATVINFAQTAITNANGDLTATFMWPGLAAGPHTFVVTGLTPVASFTQTTGAVSITGGLNSIAGKFSIVWTFDAGTQAWQLYDTAAGATSTVTTLSRGQGYWINATEDCTLVYGGNVYTLKTGWNLIGWLG